MLAALTPEGYEVRLVYETMENIPYDEPWDLVGLTGMGSGLVRAWQIADRFRSRGVQVVIGGVAASLGDPQQTLAHADALVVGEAEELWPLVLQDAQAGHLAPVYRMEQVPDLDHLPVPRYDLMNATRLGRWRPVQATRGCPHSCTYCSVNAFFHHRYRKRPVEAVVADIRAAKRNGTRYITFMDDNIGVDWDYCARLWESLIPEQIIWMSQCSLKIADQPEMLALAHRSGCRMLSVGIESTSEESLATVDKSWNRPGHYLLAIDAMRRQGIDVSAEIIVGLDGDDMTVFQRTFDFLMKAAISVPRVHILTPVPGTPLFQDMEREGRLLSKDFSRYSGGQVVFRPRRINPDALQQAYWELYQKLFSWTAILHRVARNQARLGAYMRALVIGTNLHYRQHIRHRIVPGIV
jgi:radical SAM superfamily enzyme YgiQ (UPF0313 family)